MTQGLASGTVLCMASILISKAEAADLLGVTPSAVHRMMDRGDLVAHNTIRSTHGRPVMHLFRRSDVERLCAKRAA